MPVLIGLGFMVLIWIIVVWGSSYVNKNIQ